MKPSNIKEDVMFFEVHGCKVTWRDGLAEFHHYDVLIRVPASKFTYDWVLKMEYRLSTLMAHAGH